MDFTTVVPVLEREDKITYNHKILALGSCFADNMSAVFKRYQFQQISNPFGIVFHPLAIEKLIQFAVQGYVFTEKDVFENQQIWSCYAVHSCCNQLEKDDLIDYLNAKTCLLKEYLDQANFIVFTFGTAYVYEHISSGEIVANCHKVVQKEFAKKLLTYQQIFDSYQRIINLVRSVNKTAQLVFTISPVRHIKDGVVNNQRSKSLLHAALQDVLERQEQSKVSYFPSYEILMDELRDYRFYQSDLLHPSEMALEYIWERFKEAYIATEAYEVMNKVQRVQSGLNHRPFNPTATAHLAFLDGLIEQIDFLLERYPFMNFR